MPRTVSNACRTVVRLLMMTMMMSVTGNAMRLTLAIPAEEEEKEEEKIRLTEAAACQGLEQEQGQVN